MKRASLVAAVAVVVAANAFALLHAWRNRSIPVGGDVTLTERELPVSYNRNEEDSGVSLRLSWIDPAWAFYGLEQRAPWLDRKRLHELGFDTTVEPSDAKANEFYARQRVRRAFVALEYDGPAWRDYLEQADRQDRKVAELSHTNVGASRSEWQSRLVMIDAASDAAQLRARHRDDTRVIIVPAAVSVVVQPSIFAADGTLSRPARLSGYIREAPSSIHVPRPFSDAFRRVSPDVQKRNYRVHLRYGSFYEPWIAAIDFK